MAKLMAAAKQPVVWAKRVAGDHTSSGWTNLTEYLVSTRSLADPSTYEGGYKDGRVRSWEPITRSLSDPSGQWEVSRFGWLEDDRDRRIRGELGSMTGEFHVNREAAIYLVSEAGRATATTPRILARGRLRDPQPVENMLFRWMGEDIIGADFGIWSGTKKVPQRTITRGLFPGVHKDLIGQGLPIIYGEVSDEGATDADGEPSEKGLVPLFWVGREEIAGGGWDVYLVAGHACFDIHSVFGSDLGSPAKRVKLDESVYGDTFLVPGKTGWPFADVYRDMPDANGVTNRQTIIYARGEVSEAHKSGSINLTANVCGIEDVGDGSGVLIRHAFRVYQHFIHNWVLANDGKGYYSGTWAPLTEWDLAGPTVTVINTDSFTAAQAFSAERLGDVDGYLWDFALCERVDLREMVKRANLSCDGFTGTNRHGQIFVKLIDDAADLSSSKFYRTWDFASDHLAAPEIKHRDVETAVRYAFDWDADKKKYRSDQGRISDPVIEDALGEVLESDVQQLFMVRDKATAEDVTARRLVRLKRAPRYQQIVLDLSGLDIDLGDYFRVSHPEGIGANGYDEHPFFCVRHSVDLNKDQVTVTGFDISRIVASAAPLLDDEANPAFDGILLGDETSQQAPPVGAYELR